MGSVYRRRDGMWIGSVEVPRTREQPRRRRTVSSTMFCEALRRYSQLPNAARVAATSRAERMGKARAKGTHTRAEWYAKLRTQNGICFYCGELGYTIRKVRGRYVKWPQLVKDHMVPLARGGSDGIENVVGSCARCNFVKGTLTADEYLSWVNR